MIEFGHYKVKDIGRFFFYFILKLEITQVTSPRTIVLGKSACPPAKSPESDKSGIGIPHP